MVDRTQWGLTTPRTMSDPPLVHYLTRRLRIPCRPDLKTLEGAPLNSTITEMVTCPECLDTLKEGA